MHVTISSVDKLAMEPDLQLIQQEAEFRKENDKLELQTKELMLKVNDVMKIQDNLIKAAAPTAALPANVASSVSASGDGVNYDRTATLPNNHSKATYFYQTKIKQMQSDNDQLLRELKKKNDELMAAEKANKTLADEKEKWFLQFNCTKITANKLETHIQRLKSQVEAGDSEIISLKRTIERLNGELKQAQTNANGCEVRLNRCREDVDKVRATLASSKQETKDLKESHRKHLAELTATLRTVDKHKTELIDAFKKQSQLIDNLKRQKLNLISLKSTEVAQADLMKLLNSQHQTASSST